MIANPEPVSDPTHRNVSAFASGVLGLVFGIAITMSWHWSSVKPVEQTSPEIMLKLFDLFPDRSAIEEPPAESVPGIVPAGHIEGVASGSANSRDAAQFTEQLVEFLRKINESRIEGVEGLDIKATFADGVFCLRGTVPNDEVRCAIVEIAQNIDSVCEVNDRLEISSLQDRPVDQVTARMVHDIAEHESILLPSSGTSTNSRMQKSPEQKVIHEFFVRSRKPSACLFMTHPSLKKEPHQRRTGF